MTISNGTLVFFKRAKTVVHGGKKKEVEFEGLGYGVFLGHVPPFMPAPPLPIVRAALGGCGYVLLDDVKEFLGEAVMADFLKQWQAKYTKLIDEIAKKAIESGAIKLVGPDGQPIKKEPPKLTALHTPKGLIPEGPPTPFLERIEQTKELLKGDE